MATRVRIEETTVGSVGGWRVTAGNLLVDTYRDAAGHERRGPTIELGLYDGQDRAHGEPTVGVGSAVEIDGTTWTVVAVQPAPGGENGWVELEEGGTTRS